MSIAAAKSKPTNPSHAGPWREPGQAVSAAYRRDGRLRYAAEAREIVGRNGPYFNNRPLYRDPRDDGAVLAGDRPLVRLLDKPYVHGTFAVGLIRAGRGSWLHDWPEIEARYRCGRMTWHCADPARPGTRLTLTVVPQADAAGFAVRLRSTGLRAADRLVWSFGGARPDDDPSWHWDPVMRGNPHITRSGDPRREVLSYGLMPAHCLGNVVSVAGPWGRVVATADATQDAVGRCNVPGRLHIADASALADPAALAQSQAGSSPVLCGVVDLSAPEVELCWAFTVVAAGAMPSDADPADLFAAGLARVEASERAQIATPDAHLDAAVAAVCHAVDSNCERETNVFRHGNMAFSIRFIGWRVIAGATVLGWHDRVQGSAAHYFALIKPADDQRPRAVADPNILLCHDGLDSIFYGRGTIAREGFAIYNVQSQFFDQTINEWRWTADPALERGLRPALELHLEWIRACFDPDDDGLYESYINTLPTDSVWYGGGGGAEETAYAYTGHRAARDLARRAGDTAAADRHQAQLDKIQRALRGQLWVKERGHYGLYREQGGHRRVHADTWLYGVFLPIDAGVTDLFEAWESLYYTEWALERIRLPFGGELCQLSNWVPWKWSVRDMFGGDLFHLALAHFQSGWGDAGYALLQGAALESAFASAVPGGFSHIGAATDFADNSHMFARAVVEGLFGFAPDYPNGRVLVCPAFPSAWPEASIATPDFSLSYRQDGATDRYRLTLARPTTVDFRLPVRAGKIRRVTLAGREVAWRVEPGFGCTWLRLKAEPATTLDLIVELSARTVGPEPGPISGRVGEEIVAQLAAGRIEEVRDLHGALENIRPDGATLRARLAGKPGHHLVLARVVQGDLPAWIALKVHVTDPAADAAHRARTPREAAAHARWACLDLAPHCNGDVRTIFQQAYLTPRPPTCSVRLGSDGYSAWTFPYWGLRPPAIDLAHVASLTNAEGRIVTPARVPFARFGPERNIAFTSLWDNWPTSVTVPVGQAAKTVWLLVCGSTFPMQTKIANAALHFRYADGQAERLDLVPPDNFWMLCPWGGEDYNVDLDGFCLPAQPPPQVQLGRNCRAVLLSWTLRPGVPLASVTLETLSEDVVIGLMGLSLELA